MRPTFLLASVCLLASAVGATGAVPPCPASAGDVSGDWEMSTVLFGNTLAERVHFDVEKGKLTGTSSGRPLTATLDCGQIRFETKDRDGTVNTYEGRLEGGRLS